MVNQWVQSTLCWRCWLTVALGKWAQHHADIEHLRRLGNPDLPDDNAPTPMRDALISRRLQLQLEKRKLKGLINCC